VLQGHTDWVNAVALSSDGRRVVSGSYDKTLRVWDIESGQSLRTLQGHTSEVNAVALSSDGRRVVSGSRDHTLRVWDLKDGKELVTFTVEGNVTGCAVAPDNRTIVAGDSFGRVHFLRLEGVD
jgi:WD40 repeat protein